MAGLLRSVSLTGTPDHHDGDLAARDLLRLVRGRRADPEELARYFPLSELEPVEPGSLMGLMSESVYSYQPTEPSSCRNCTSHLTVMKVIRCRIGSSSLCQASTVTAHPVPGCVQHLGLGVLRGKHSPAGASVVTRIRRGPVLRGGKPMRRGYRRA